MHTEIGTITAKGQTTIPASIRKALSLEPHDKILFQQQGNQITIQKISSNQDDQRMIEQLCNNEWGSAADNEAYNDL